MHLIINFHMSCTKIGVRIPLSLFFQLSCSELSILTQETYKLINLIPSKVEAKTPTHKVIQEGATEDIDDLILAAVEMQKKKKKKRQK